jgi:AcrR family transcriptional regulator
MTREDVDASSPRPPRTATPTRQLLLQAAQREIAESGYEGVSLRGIARGADVDPSLVRHYFGSKNTLLAEAVSTDDEFAGLAPTVLTGPAGALGRRIVATALRVWGSPDTSATALARLSASLTSADVAMIVERDLVAGFLGAIAAEVSPDHHRVRAELAAGQLLALALARFVVGDPLLSEGDEPELIRIVGRTIQRFLLEPMPAEAVGGRLR